MPDFNFAKGSGKRDSKATSPSGSGQAPAMGVPPKGPAATSTDTPAAGGNPGAQAPRRSVLDKYPERDLSHLTGESVPADDAGADYSRTSPPPLATASGPSEDVPAEAETGTASSDPSAPTEASMKPAQSKSNAPLVAFLVIVGLLLAVAFIWFVNPYPPLRDALAGFFSSGKQTESPAVAPRPAVPDTPPPAAMRSWDYFVQVSSWKELSKADLDAERFRAQGFDVIVESEFIRAKGGTWYRVRLGPYESADAARGIVAANANILPKGVYVDSVRLADDTPLEDLPPVGQDAAPAAAGRTATGGREEASSSAPRVPGRDFEVIDEPMSGWAVKVSSLKDAALARAEARKLLQQGYPSFITKKILGGVTWYRVLVGPFNEKSDADRYQQLLNVTYGNDAYTVNLAGE